MRRRPDGGRPEEGRRTTRLRALLEEPGLAFLVEAHSGLSARIAEEAGFPALWASGLAISASLGVRDSNEASWTQVLEVAEFMADATTVPILLDGDTGFGDFNNLRRVVRKVEQRGIAGICVEDKRFPKRNSFVRGADHALAPVEEFVGKLQAARDAATDADFVLVARTEALIAGCGLEEALRRAEAYREAGADAVLVHSRSPSPDEVFRFLDAWGGRSPVILVPTTYFETPAAAFRERGVSAVIWANHLLRASAKAMQEVAARIAAEASVTGIDDRIVALEEIFRLQGDDELRRAERMYSADAGGHAAVVLAATRGEALGELTAEVPKTMLRIGGRSILERTVEALRDRDVRPVRVVVGWRADTVDVAGIEKVENARHAETGEIASLDAALGGPDGRAVAGPVLVLFGDVLFKPYLLDLLLRDPADALVLADAEGGRPGRGGRRDDRASDFLVASRPDSPAALADDDVRLERAWTGAWSEDADGEWPGLLKLSARGLEAARAWIGEARSRPGFDALGLTDLLNGLVRATGVKVHYIRGHWTDVDRLPDLDQPEAW